MGLTDDDDPSLKAALDLQAASYLLIVVRAKPTGFDVRFDFHTYSSPFGR